MARISILLVILALAAACATVPYTGRRQFNVISDSQLNALAVKAFNEVIEKEPPSKDERLKSIVQRVAERISKAADALDRPGFQWEVRVIDRDVPNAFCLPGGKIVVYKGILQYAKNEAGLAGIIGHEVAHAVARHGAERLSQKLVLEGAISLGQEIIRKEDGTIDQRARMALGALGLGGTVGIVLPYSRLHEFEADRIGQIYMARAGYEPAESMRLWDRLSKIKKPPIPVWLSTHPADEDRVQKLRETLPDAQKYYQAAPAKYGLGSLL
jgi:predicted Zn-dependent protease